MPTAGWLCIGIGGIRIDRAVAAQIVEAVSEHAIEAAIQAADQSIRGDNEIRQALCRELEEARYETSLAARRYEVVDPTKRLFTVGDFHNTCYTTDYLPFPAPTS